jgi:hypothetical protein
VRLFAAIGLAVCLFAPAALAQDVDLSVGGSYGHIALSTGFPGPYKITLPAGGAVSANGLGEGCVGIISERALYSVDFTAGALPLFFTASSRDDTTLAVHTPDGKWLCDDDSFGDHNPMVRAPAPASGRYQVFIGVYSPESGAPNAVLQVSEGAPPPRIDASRLDLQ